MIRPFGHSGKVSSPDHRHGTRKAHNSNNISKFTDNQSSSSNNSI